MKISRTPTLGIRRTTFVNQKGGVSIKKVHRITTFHSSPSPNRQDLNAGGNSLPDWLQSQTEGMRDETPLASDGEGGKSEQETEPEIIPPVNS